MKICAVYSLKIPSANLSWWMVSFSASKHQDKEIGACTMTCVFCVGEEALRVVLGFFFPKRTPKEEREL